MFARVGIHIARPEIHDSKSISNQVRVRAAIAALSNFTATAHDGGAARFCNF